jgi:hypothetical protein
MDTTYRDIRSRDSARAAIGLGTRALTAVALVASGILFVAYPALRPFSSETGIEGAQAFASTDWIIAHSLAMAGFILLGLGLLGVLEDLRGSAGERLASWGIVLSWVGIGMTLPYYGAEVFGLHAVGQAVVDRNDTALMSIVNDIRWEVGIFWILAGLAALAVGVILFAIAISRSGRLARWSGIVLAIAFALYIPQFAAGQPLRVAHGVLILIGALILAWAMVARPGETVTAGGRVPRREG